MTRKPILRSLKACVLILILVVGALGDVAPDAGFTNVPADLVLETTADLSGYRFFLESPTDVEEVELNSGLTVIAAAGRGGAARYVRLIAVPLSDITISGELTSSLLENLVQRKQFPNAREVLSHNFQATISVIEKPVWTVPVYRLTIENGEVTATKLEVIPVVGGSSWSIVSYAIPVVAAGVLIAVGIAIIGIWLFRRSRKRV